MSKAKGNSGANNGNPDNIPDFDLPAWTWDGLAWDASTAFGFDSYLVTLEQKEVIDRAIQKCRNACDFPDMYEGRALELIAAEFLA